MPNAITIAVSNGRIFKDALPLLAAAGVVPVDDPDTSRKLILDTNRADVKLVLLRASDVPTYVEYGAADLGIAGKDVLLEYGGARFAGGPRAAPHRHQIRQLHAALLRRAGQAGRDHQAVRFHGAGATGGPRRPDRRSRGHRQYPQGQRPRAARTHRRREFAPDRQQGFYEDEARPRHRLRPQPRRSRRRAAAGALTRRTAMTAIQRLTTTAPDFWPRLQQLLAWESVSDAAVAKTVDDILADVQQRGDAAVLEYTNRFDRMQARSIGELEIPAVRLHEALARLPAATRAAMETAVARLRAYHQHLKQETWTYTEADGTVLGQQVTALDRVGLYVPGGKAAYPS